MPPIYDVAHHSPGVVQYRFVETWQALLTADYGQEVHRHDDYAIGVVTNHVGCHVAFLLLLFVHAR
jgi:hypothetical protein